MGFKGPGTYQEAVSIIDGCTKCVLSNFRNNIVKYRGNPKAEVMVIGEAPGFHEDRTGKAMCGKTGSYLVNLLSDNGLSLYDVFITNTVLCRSPRDEDPLPEYMDACAEWMNLQIELVDPTVILACGRIASSRLLPWWSSTSRITREEGNVYQPPHLEGKLVIPIRHPSAIMRNPSSKSGYEEFIASLCDMIKSGKYPEPKR